LVEEVFLVECECDGSVMEEMRGVVVASDLKWGGGGCDKSDLGVAVAVVTDLR
jgi:hypothetical protein